MIDMAKIAFRLGGVTATPNKLSNKRPILGADLSQLAGTTLFNCDCGKSAKLENDDEPVVENAKNGTNYKWDYCVASNKAKHGDKAESICNKLKEKYGNCTECTHEKIQNELDSALSSEPTVENAKKKEVEPDEDETPCPKCDGKGFTTVEGKKEKCSECDGTGMVDDDDDETVENKGKSTAKPKCELDNCHNSKQTYSQLVNAARVKRGVSKPAKSPMVKNTAPVDVYERAGKYFLSNKALPKEIQDELDTQIAKDFPDVK